MRAIILAGGRGTRLRPFTTSLPKPLLPVSEYPIAEIIVRQLANHGFKRITIAVNYQAELIKAYFGNGDKWNIKIDYSYENTALGTMGPLNKIKDLPDNFIVMNGDILCDIEYSIFLNNHIENANLFTVAGVIREDVVDYGVIEVSGNKVANFNEKPKNSFCVSAGIYAVNKEVLSFIPEGPFGFDNLMHSLLRNKKKINYYSHHGLWLDIGRPSDYADAIETFDNLKKNFLP